MHRRQPLPRLWMMTDERQGEDLWSVLHRLPRGSGVVFRHHGLSPSGRAELFKAVAAQARKRRLLLLFAGDPQLARSLGADGSHGRRPSRRPAHGIHSAPAHNIREIRQAERCGADVIFLSPVFPTRSHPGARTLGRTRFAALSRKTHLPVIALGGMNERRVRGLSGAYGWAAIDAWSTIPASRGPAYQKRKAVPM